MQNVRSSSPSASLHFCQLDIYIYIYTISYLSSSSISFSFSSFSFFVLLFWYSSHDASLHSRGKQLFFFKSILVVLFENTMIYPRFFSSRLSYHEGKIQRLNEKLTNFSIFFINSWNQSFIRFLSRKNNLIFFHELSSSEKSLFRNYLPPQSSSLSKRSRILSKKLSSNKKRLLEEISRDARVQRSNDDDTVKIGQKRPGGSCSEADSSSSFGWLVAWLAGSAGSGSSSGSSSNSQNSQTGASPSSPAAIYIGSNHAATPTASSRRYDSSSNGLYPLHTTLPLWLSSLVRFNNRIVDLFFFLIFWKVLEILESIYFWTSIVAKVSFEILFINIRLGQIRVFACDWINTNLELFYFYKLCFRIIYW